MVPIQTPREAELAVAAWLEWAGHNNVRATQYTSDAGIDVESGTVGIQVKFQARPVGRPALQGIYGAASVRGLEPWFVSLGGYTQQAEAWAKNAGMPLFVMDTYGRVRPFNLYGRRVVANIDNPEPPPRGVPEAPAAGIRTVRTGPGRYQVVDDTSHSRRAEVVDGCLMLAVYGFVAFIALMLLVVIFDIF